MGGEDVWEIIERSITKERQIEQDNITAAQVARDAVAIPNPSTSCIVYAPVLRYRTDTAHTLYVLSRSSS